MTGPLTVSINGTFIPASIIIQNVEIKYGAPYGVGISAGEPASAVFQIVDLPSTSDVQIGDRVEINATPIGSPVIVHRFTGRVYSRKVEWPNVDRSIMTVACQGPMAMMGRTYIGGDTSWPVETDGDRMARIFTDVTAQDSTFTGVAEPGTVDVLARSAEIATAGDLASAIALSGMGFITDTPDGTVRYYDKDHVKNVTSDFTLSAANILEGFTLSKSADTVINDISINYGNRAIDPRLVVSDTSPASIGSFGLLGADFDSELDNAGDAADLAAEWLYRYSQPREDFPSLTISGRVKDDDLYYVSIGAVVNVTGLPQPAYFRASAVITAYIERWRTTSEWEIELDLLDAELWGRGITWDDVDITDYWNTIDSSYTWNDISEFYEPNIDVGRWMDAPANYTYANIDPLVEWQDWSG